MFTFFVEKQPFILQYVLKLRVTGQVIIASIFYSLNVNI